MKYAENTLVSENTKVLNILKCLDLIYNVILNLSILQNYCFFWSTGERALTLLKKKILQYLFTGRWNILVLKYFSLKNTDLLNRS